MDVTELCDESPQVISLADDGAADIRKDKNQGLVSLFSAEEI